jgi:cytochrome P450
MITRLEDQARAWARTIVDRALERDQCNFVHEVAYQLPMHMIADIVGIPVSDREWLFDRVNLFLSSTDPRSRLSRAEISAIEAEMYGYAQQLGEEKRRAPADDVWTTLIEAEIDHDDGERTRLSPIEARPVLHRAHDRRQRDHAQRDLGRPDGVRRASRPARCAAP